jgi:23S rRNA pseudouridine1911/1915/1917 synthase
MRVKATTEEVGLRLDVWLSRRLPELSRARIQALIKSGNISDLDGERLRAHAGTRDGMEVEVDIPPPRPVETMPEDVPLDVIYEDGDIIVLNKPAGMVVHPAPGHGAGTLVNALLYHCPDLPGIGGEIRPGIVHRLDRDTTGAMVVAKNEAAMAGLVQQFKTGKVRKEYVAVVHGIPRPAEGRIETLIGRSRHDRKKMSSSPVRGRTAVTNYAIEEVFGNACLVRVKIETGRTHQIRVHMKHLGNPVIGDRQYGRTRTPERGPEMTVARQMLHSEILGFVHPCRGGKKNKYKAPVPEDMLKLIEELRGRIGV